MPSGGADAEAIGHMLDRIGRELAWSAPARDRVLEACLNTLLLDAWRLHVSAIRRRSRSPVPVHGWPRGFAATVEAGFRRRSRMSAYADALGAEPAALRAATRALTGRSPSGLLRDRQRLEASGCCFIRTSASPKPPMRSALKTRLMSRGCSGRLPGSRLARIGK